MEPEVWLIQGQSASSRRESFFALEMLELLAADEDFLVAPQRFDPQRRRRGGGRRETTAKSALPVFRAWMEAAVLLLRSLKRTSGYSLVNLLHRLEQAAVQSRLRGADADGAVFQPHHAGKLGSPL